MPKASLKIDRFDGGLNRSNNSRDIEDNQSSNLVDVNINTVGKVTLSGGAQPFFPEIEKIEVQEDGWGLFFFRSDYDIVDEAGLKGGPFLHGSDNIGKNVDFDLGSETSVDVLAKLFDPVNTDSGQKSSIVLREQESENWTTLIDGLPLYQEDEYVKAPVRSNFHIKNGNLRIWDSNFKQFGMFTKWLGVVKNTKFIDKDNVNYNSSIVPSWNKSNAWLYTHAECKPPASVQTEINKRTGVKIADVNGAHGDAGITIAMNGLNTSLNFVIGDIIKINDELLYVSSASTSSGDFDLSVTRGVYGSQAASISNDTEVYLVYRPDTKGEVYSPFNYAFNFHNNVNALSHNEYPCQVIALDFTNSGGSGSMYTDSTPMLTAAEYDDTNYDSNTTVAHGSHLGWGVATDGINHWAREFDGIQFMYEFVAQGTETDEQLKESWLQGNKFRFYASLIYDGAPDIDGQESAMVDITPANSGELRQNAHLYCNLSVKWTGMNENYKYNANAGDTNTESTYTSLADKDNAKELYINPRVTGCRIYYSSSENNDLTKFLLLTANFDENGGIKKEGGNYMPWCPVNYGNIANPKLSYYRVSSKGDEFGGISSPHQINLSQATGEARSLGEQQITLSEDSGAGGFDNSSDNWSYYDPTGSGAGSLSYYSGFAALQINPSTDNVIQGINLPIAHLDGVNQDNPIKANTRYLVHFSNGVLSSNETFTVTVSLGGGTATLTNSAVDLDEEKEVEITTVNNTGDLQIYYQTTNSSNTFRVFLDIRVKEIKGSDKGESFYIQSPPGGQTYDSLNGHDGETTNVLYKCSTEVNGIRYVGNVCYPLNWDLDKADVPDASFEDLTRGTKYGDRMIRSAPGQFDVLNPQMNVDVVVNDGEEITHLESLGNYLLQFKENSLYILNITIQEDDTVKETLQGTYKYKGVKKPCNVVKTDREIFWVNKYGAFIFNGEAVIDVSKDKLSLNDIKRFDESLVVGCDIVERTIIIKFHDNKGFSYHLDNQGWVLFKDTFDAEGFNSNFTNDKEGRLVYSVYNTDQIDVKNVNGLFLLKQIEITKKKHLLKTSASNPSDTNQSSINFLTDNFFTAGKVLNVTNTGITQSAVSTKGLKFNQFTFFDSHNSTTKISLIFDLTSSTTVAHLGIGDVVYIGDNERYFNSNHPDFEGYYRMTGLSGYWQVKSFGATEVGLPASRTEDDPFGDINDDDDDEITPTGGIVYPNVFYLEKRIDVGDGEHLSNLKIEEAHDNDLGEDVTQQFIDTVINQSNTSNDDASTIFRFLTRVDDSGWVYLDTGVIWNTVFENERLSITNGNKLNSRNYFDGVYKIDQIIDATTISLDKTFGDAQNTLHWSDALNQENNYNFNRFYYDKFDTSNLAFTPAEVITDDRFYSNFPSSNLQYWNRESKGSSDFKLHTKDLDFNEPSTRKRIYKLYVSYGCINTPRVRIYALITTKQGVFTLFPDLSKCENYGILNTGSSIQLHPNLNPGDLETFFPSTISQVGNDYLTNTMATIVFNDPSNILRDVQSIKIGFVSSGVNLNSSYQNSQTDDTSYTLDPSVSTGDYKELIKTDGQFTIDDINIVYRAKNVK